MRLAQALAPTVEAAPRGRRREEPAAKTIPFDYVFKLELSGVAGNRVQDVVAISVEGTFVGVALGYSLLGDERRLPRSFEPVADPATVPRAPVIGAVIVPPGPVIEAVPAGARSALPEITEPHVLVAGSPGAEVAVVDLASPAEAAPLAGTLGGDGTASFAVSSGRTILQARDVTNGLVSQAVQLNSDSRRWTPTIGPEPGTGKLPAAPKRGGEDGALGSPEARRGRTVHVYGMPNDRVELHVLRAGDAGVEPIRSEVRQLEAEPLELPLGQGAKLERGEVGRAEVMLDQDKPILAAGDLLQVRSQTSGITLSSSTFSIPRPRTSTLTLGAVAAGLERAGADLTRGFRVHPRSSALFAGGLPLDQLSERALNGAFLTGCQAASEVSFRYGIDVVGTGRELQSEPIHNIAGLGIADGDRPFRPFAQPIVFEPRSSIRIQVEELAGPPGTLYIVLQGYKVLGTARLPE